MSAINRVTESPTEKLVSFLGKSGRVHPYITNFKSSKLQYYLGAGSLARQIDASKPWICYGHHNRSLDYFLALSLSGDTGNSQSPD